jgi:hypothetical protein
LFASIGRIHRGDIGASTVTNINIPGGQARVDCRMPVCDRTFEMLYTVHKTREG